MSIVAQQEPRSIKILLGSLGIGLLVAGISFFSLPTANPRAQVPADPWTAAQTVVPAQLVKELGDPRNHGNLVVVCVGFRPLFQGAHIPGAVFHGAAQSPEGLADLKKWAQTLPRQANLVIYCGCCPLAPCPNVRPAFVALHEMAFARLRVLLLPNDFATDWVGKGYPTQKGD